MDLGWQVFSYCLFHKLDLKEHLQTLIKGHFWLGCHFMVKTLTGVVWYCSSPHTSWALWCYNAHGICSRTFGNGNHSKETSGKYHRMLASDMSSEPVKDREMYIYFCSSSTYLNERILQMLQVLTKLCVVKGTWSKTSTSSSSPINEVESVFQSIRNFLLLQKWMKAFKWRDMKAGKVTAGGKNYVYNLWSYFPGFKTHNRPELTSSVLDAAWRQRSTEAADLSPSGL